MQEEEKKIFWKLDDKLYLVSKNTTYKKIFKSYQKHNSDRLVQEFIDKLISWYSVKFSDRYIKLFLDDEIDNIDDEQIMIMTFEKLLERTNNLIVLKEFDNTLFHQYLVAMAGWGLIYSKNTNPNFGFFRVCQMFDDFNTYYGWKLNPNVYKSILEYDYSLNNSNTLNLLSSKKNNSDKVKKSKFKALMKIKNKLPKK